MITDADVFTHKPKVATVGYIAFAQNNTTGDYMQLYPPYVHASQSGYLPTGLFLSEDEAVNIFNKSNEVMIIYKSLKIFRLNFDK